ncbi:MAG: mechanosensitive ion channel family protein [Ignavibacteria bacterium]|nr:mechanosensitive ion channel family protein [Ignavibacteria bacterium]
MQEELSRLLFDPTVGKLIGLAIGLLIVVVLHRLVNKGIGKYLSENETRYRARKFSTFLAYLAGIVVLLLVFSDKLGGLTVALGVAGAGIAFALQEVIASVAGWVAITFARFYNTGDRVQLGGIKGDVIDIGVLRTTLMEIGDWVKGDLYNGRVVRVANSFVFKEPVFNYSGDFPFLWDEVTIPVRYGSDLSKARSVLEAAAKDIVGEYVPTARAAWQAMVKKYLIEDASVEPMVTLVANDNWVEFTLRYVVDFKRRRTTKDLLFQRVLAEVDKLESVTLASATFEVVGIPDVRLRQ